MLVLVLCDSCGIGSAPRRLMSAKQRSVHHNKTFETHRVKVNYLKKIIYMLRTYSTNSGHDETSSSYEQLERIIL